jgi:hypothetical protein
VNPGRLQQGTCENGRFHTTEIGVIVLQRYTLRSRAGLPGFLLLLTRFCHRPPSLLFFYVNNKEAGNPAEPLPTTLAKTFPLPDFFKQ